MKSVIFAATITADAVADDVEPLAAIGDISATTHDNGAWPYQTNEPAMRHRKFALVHPSD